MPMQKRLPEKHYFRLSIFILLILLSVAPVCFAQIAITESKPIDIRFSLDQTTISNSGINVSMYELLDMHGALGQPASNNVVSYSDQVEGNPFYYISDESRYIFPGRIQS